MSAKPDSVKEPSKLPFRVLMILLVASLIALAGAAYINVQDEAEDSYYRTFGGDLRVSELQVVNSARLAVQGDEESFSELSQAQKDFLASLTQLKSGSDDFQPITDWLGNDYNALNKTWLETSTAIDTILANQERILFLHEVAATLNESIPELQQEYNLVVDIMVESGSNSDQAVLAQRQALLGERIARNVGKMLEGGADAADAADQFNLDASLFGSVLDGMIDGNIAMRIDQVTDEEALESLLEIKELYAFVNNSVDEIFQASPDLLNTRQAVETVLGSSSDVNSKIDRLVGSIDGIAEQRLLQQEYILGIAGFIVFVIILMGIFASRDASRRLELEAQTNENSQRAILTLLDELADLADGDLRGKATVTEEFTGAIADSVNFTIDQLRVLVSRINDSSESISNASEEAKTISAELTSATQRQAQEITEATLSINEMADTIDGVANEASRSSMVAQSSVAIAKNGANVVRDTIGGMNTIREQIQDTSKRIKRLGESSQEIGDIVSLINDIADQTNILSLNAAIQASMAGDAGRGFAVVADEVQRLAERSSAATKQIEALVKTIQTDTNEAVISMEQTTTEVVHGARLAEDAGVALEEIETVSADIAKLILDISDAARQQSGKATSVSDRMNVIQDITTQTSSGTAKTAESIGKLTALSSSMRDSVTGFTLPEAFVNQAAANEDSSELDVLSESEDEASVDAAMYDTVSELGEFDAAEEDYDLENEAPEGALDENVVEESLEQTVQMQSLDDEEEVSFEDMEDDTALSDQTVMLAESTLDSLEAPAEESLADQLDVAQETAADELASLDADDEFELDLEDTDEDTAPSAEQASQEVTEKPDEDDELVLDMDDDFDLDLDEFSFDDDSDKSSK